MILGCSCGLMRPNAAANLSNLPLTLNDPNMNDSEARDTVISVFDMTGRELASLAVISAFDSHIY